MGAWLLRCVASATHGLTASKRACGALKADVARNGMVQPIKHVEHGGANDVVDGNHRLAAARQPGMSDGPRQKVAVTYGSLAVRHAAGAFGSGSRLF
jgi:hypothetical protein